VIGKHKLIGVQVLLKGDQGLAQGPAAAARPGWAIERQRCPERIPAFSVQKRPGNRQIAGGIATPPVSLLFAIFRLPARAPCGRALWVAGAGIPRGRTPLLLARYGP